MESKWSIHQLLPSRYSPKTLFFESGAGPELILSKINSSKMRYPLIGKPDIGMKGLAVKKLNSQIELFEYASNSKVNFLVQEFIPFRNEVGIFYYRFPGEQKGRISGIVSKEFLSVKGDGQLTIKELLKLDKRYVLQLPILGRTHSDLLNKILEKEEECLLVPYGNHVRGAKFLDISHLADEQLTNIIDDACQQIPGFYYGRMDVRYNSWEELKNGKNFSIIELNGAGSEPTHMYDPGHSVFFAWKEIIRHWNILSKISRLNHHSLHRPYMNTRSGLAMLKENSQYLRVVNDQM